jgi:hypothetical protein
MAFCFTTRMSEMDLGGYLATGTVSPAKIKVKSDTAHLTERELAEI